MNLNKRTRSNFEGRINSGKKYETKRRNSPGAQLRETVRGGKKNCLIIETSIRITKLKGTR